MEYPSDTPGPSPDPLFLAVLRQLPERDAAIMAYRFGVNDGQMHTLVETAAEFGIDRKAIQLCEAAAVEALRAARGGNAERGD